MSKLIKIAAISDINEGKIREFNIEGLKIALAKIEGDFFAFEASCTHALCALAGGFLDGHTVTCYCHGAQFDIKTGGVLSPPATVPLKTYKIKEDKGQLFIEI